METVPGRQELPPPLERSSRDARHTRIKAHDSAVEQYGEGERTHRVAYGERAHRVAYGALKYTHEKVGHHWERKERGRKGPSDPRSAKPRGRGAHGGEGVGENASKEHPYDVAGRLDVEGRSRMSKAQLLDAVRRANRSRTRDSRSG
ncbi:ChaB family protein [Streptomyces sp. NPDC020801]|uniref:ChaB family protein n=1 Tax=Streptomyces sp. NPDC020801 TaxID=3365093 RepID=UPI0037BD28D6